VAAVARESFIAFKGLPSHPFESSRIVSLTKSLIGEHRILVSGEYPRLVGEISEGSSGFGNGQAYRNEHNW